MFSKIYFLKKKRLLYSTIYFLTIASVAIGMRPWLFLLRKYRICIFISPQFEPIQAKNG